METNYPLKLWVYTFCYNEEKILPYVIEYWKQYATKVVVYDNGSTDNSLKILSQYSWIEVREFDTENTFDPEKISQYKSFCYADAIGKADYVMVCDIDEVLLPTENLFPELILAKKDDVQLFQTKYYEIINNELNPNYDSLIHTIEGVYAYPNSNIHKAIIFDPRIKIAFGPNSLTYSTNKNYITKSIITLHLKMISSNILVSRQKNLYLRLNKKCKYQDDVLYYGNIKNIGTRLSYFKLLFPYKYRFNKNENYITISDDTYAMIKNSIKFKELTWLPTKINHNSKSSNKECIFGIPIYKSDLTIIEKASLTQLCKIIQNKFEICLICPEDLNLREYVDIAEKYDVKLSTLFCAKQYFTGTATYSYMCETADFYKCFSEYKYLFIYQLDGWIFEDNIQKYLDLDVDYIGSPWNVGSFNLQCDTIGNGGVSLRKVQKFIDVCNSFTPEDYEKDWVKTEDLFFCKTMKLKANFKLPTVQVGSNFSLCGLWGRFMTKYNDGKLPMCLHGWHRDYLTYWKRYINLDEFETTGDIKIVQQPIQPVQKSDYKTRLELIKMRLNNSNKPINIQLPAKIENTKIENKKEITQNTTMSSAYTDFYKDYYGIKKTMKWEGDKQTIMSQSANLVEPVKQEDKKVEVKQENIKNDNILICIFNYKHDDNARRWLNLLSPHFETYVLDSGNDKKINDFIQFPNIYYSGLFNETKKLAEKKPYKWVGIICSDVLIDNINSSKLIEKLNWLLTTEDIGQYQPAFDKNSYKWRGNNINLKYKLEGKHLLDGPIIFMNTKLFQKFPYIDTKINLYGWGISRCFSVFCTKMNYYNVFDNTLYVTHPVGTGYSSNKAEQQVKAYIVSVANTLNLDIKKINYSTKLSNSLGDITNQIKYVEKEKIVITLTSWKKRISNVKTVLFDIINYQIKKPDLCIINLSSEEFPNKEQELPQDLLELIKTSKIKIEINWIDGPNTKQWKKILPTLQKYPNDIIICIDDDFIYPNDLISVFYKKHLEFPNNPISGNKIVKFGAKCHCGCASLVKNEYFDNIQNYLKDNKIYEYYSSDIFFTYVAEKSNHPYIYVGKEFFTNMKTYQANDALSTQVHTSKGIKETWNYLVNIYGPIK